MAATEAPRPPRAAQSDHDGLGVTDSEPGESSRVDALLTCDASPAIFSGAPIPPSDASVTAPAESRPSLDNLRSLKLATAGIPRARPSTAAPPAASDRLCMNLPPKAQSATHPQAPVKSSNLIMT